MGKALDDLQRLFEDVRGYAAPVRLDPGRATWPRWGGRGIHGQGRRQVSRRKGVRMGITLLLVLLVLFLYLLPFREKTRTRSYAPSAVVGVLFVALLVLLVSGLLSWEFATGLSFP